MSAKRVLRFELIRSSASSRIGTPATLNVDMSQYAPIALFVYNRLAHTRLVIDSLKLNPESSETDLIVFSDGPKKNSDDKQLADIKELRNYLREVSGFRSLKVIEREENFGLAKSIITGVSDVLKEHETVIVMEDDLVSSKCFLRYINEALRFYWDDDRVISIHGYCYPVQHTFPETFFIRGADGWGCVTWRRGWSLFDDIVEKLLDHL